MMKVNIALVDRGFTQMLLSHAKNCEEGIFVVNENSMIDIESINIKEEKIEKYAVDLKTFEGNKNVSYCLKELIKYSKENDVLFFPGTLLEMGKDFFSVCMPIIEGGKIIGKRWKITSSPYVDDWNMLLKKYRKGNCEDLPASLRHIFFKGPLKIVYEEVKEIYKKKAVDSLKSFKKDSHRILPVICNEMNVIYKFYNDKPVDIVVHSCDTFFPEDKARIEYYKNIAYSFWDHSVTEEEFYIVACEIGESPKAGIFKVKNDRIKEYKGQEI